MNNNLIHVNTDPDILKYDNRKAIELAQTLGRPLTSREYEMFKIRRNVNTKNNRRRSNQRSKSNI